MPPSLVSETMASLASFLGLNKEESIANTLCTLRALEEGTDVTQLFVTFGTH
jgi:hypothetical protein